LQTSHPALPPGGCIKGKRERVRGQFANSKEVNRFLIGQFSHMGKFFFRTRLKKLPVPESSRLGSVWRFIQTLFEVVDWLNRYEQCIMLYLLSIYE
jgi:hypothetical protein